MPRPSRWLCLLLFCLPWPTLALAQEKVTESASESNPAVPAPGHSIHGEAFNEGPRQRARLMDGMGRIEFPVSIRSAEGQAFMNQGVAQLHTFYYLEAERSFRQAALIDPDCAMAYWGMAMANVNNPKRARGFLKAAQQKAGACPVTRREQLYLDALAASLKEGQGVDDKARRQGMLEGLEAIVQEFPQDLDARAWLAMTAWQNSSKGDGIGSRQAVDALLDAVLAVQPMHPGAHHYRIHLWDGVKPARAELSASLYARAAPGIAHAWHMPGHTYDGLKRYADAAYQQEGSARVDHAAMLRERTMPFEIHNYAHNNQWLVTSLARIGRVRQAITVARNLVEQPRDPQKNNDSDGGSAQRSGRIRWAETLTRYELWDDLIRLTEDGTLDWSDQPPERKERVYTLGLAHAARSDRARLAEQIAALQAMVHEEPRPRPRARPKLDGPVGELAGALAPVLSRWTEKLRRPRPSRREGPRTVAGAPSALAELRGYEALLEGDTAKAFEHFAKARDMRAESRARAHSRAGQHDKAIEVARDAVKQGEGQFPPLAALVEVLHAAGKDAEARQAYADVLPFLGEADPDLPVVRRLRDLAATWEASGWGPPAPPATREAIDVAGQRRVPLEPLGPLTWRPYPAEAFTLVDTEGKPHGLSGRPGRNLILLFYLGGKCAHCMQQLQLFGKEFEAFASEGTDILAISTDDLEATRALKQNAEGLSFPMPLLADPKLELFRAYRCYDDFEGSPLHGTFLIDPDGGVRYHRIGAEPFLDVEFLRKEARRIGRLRGRSPEPSEKP